MIATQPSLLQYMYVGALHCRKRVFLFDQATTEVSSSSRNSAVRCLSLLYPAAAIRLSVRLFVLDLCPYNVAYQRCILWLWLL